MTLFKASARLDPVQKKEKWKNDRDGLQRAQEFKKHSDLLLSCVLFDEAQTSSLISTQEISLGRRWVDKRPQRAFVDGERKRGDKRGGKIENGQDVQE